jgi:hypothetical protein
MSMRAAARAAPGQPQSAPEQPQASAAMPDSSDSGCAGRAPGGAASGGPARAARAAAPACRSEHTRRQPLGDQRPRPLRRQPTASARLSGAHLAGGPCSHGVRLNPRPPC